MKKYTITKEFISGYLKGAIHQTQTDENFKIGEVRHPIKGSSYKIVKIEQNY